MSLILEALRRSEAERRRASLPSLLGESAPPRTPRRSPWPIALAGLLMGLLVAGGLAWWFVRPRPTTGDVGVATATPAAPPAAPEPTPILPPPERIPVAAYATLPPAATTAPPPAPAGPAAPPAPTPTMPASAPPPAAVAPDVESTPPRAEDPSFGLRPGDLPLDTLLGSQREALPPLRLSMHVYAEDPTRRFAIVDGQRLREGDALANGLQVLAIQRDGLRLAWNGRVLWVPR